MRKQVLWESGSFRRRVVYVAGLGAILQRENGHGEWELDTAQYSMVQVADFIADAVFREREKAPSGRSATKPAKARRSATPKHKPKRGRP